MVPTPLKMGVVQENDECGICMFEYLLILPILFYILNAFVKKKNFIYWVFFTNVTIVQLCYIQCSSDHYVVTIPMRACGKYTRECVTLACISILMEEWRYQKG